MLIKIGCQALRRDSGLKNENYEAISYTIERDFLAKITVMELVNRIIKSHMNDNTERGNVLNEKHIGK